MVTTADIADIILDALRSKSGAGPAASRVSNYRRQLSEGAQRSGRWGFHASQPFNRSYTSLPARKIFLSEYDIKKLWKPGDLKLSVPKNAIVSPLAQEWLEAKGIVMEFSQI